MITMNFTSVNTRLPELYNVAGLQVSDIVPVILKDKSYRCASLWDTIWRDASTGKIIENVTHWGELNV